MKKFIIFLLFPVLVYSQFSEVSQPGPVYFSNIEGIKGHKYLFDSWGEGTLILSDTVRSYQSKIQFDLVSGNIILGSNKPNSGFIVNDNSVTAFIIKNKKNSFRFVRKERIDFLGGNNSKKYFITLDNSKNHLLLKDLNKILSEPSTIKSSYTSTNNDKIYKKKTIYYLLNKDRKYIKLDKLKKKDILNILSDKKSDVKAYLSQNKLNLKNEKDVVKLLAYYHSK